MNDKVLILKDFITNDEHKILKEWITKEFEAGKMPLLPSAHKCYPKCRFKGHDNEGIKEFQSVRERITERFKLEGRGIAKPLGHFTMVMDDGASLGKHTDSGNKHLRFNLLIEKPDSGNLYIGKNTYSLDEKDLCCFFPSEMQHWSDTIVGRRSTCSYGFIVPTDWELI